jgi:hypothetical protein
MMLNDQYSHLTIFNPENSSFFLHVRLHLAERRLELFACRRWLPRAGEHFSLATMRSEMDHISTVVNLIIYWMWKEMMA